MKRKTFSQPDKQTYSLSHLNIKLQKQTHIQSVKQRNTKTNSSNTNIQTELHTQINKKLYLIQKKNIKQETNI